MAKIKGRLEIDKERCKGCAVCLTACPFSILELGREVNSKGYNYPRVVDLERCTGCASCATVCPDSCITVYRTKQL
ncbi:ferredoxin [Bacteroidia bacterium]|nr:ferredoxin [Bacteroidia bacterium]